MNIALALGAMLALQGPASIQAKPAPPDLLHAKLCTDVSHTFWIELLSASSRLGRLGSWHNSVFEPSGIVRGSRAPILIARLLTT